MKENVDLEDYIDVVEPDGLNEARLQKLEFFRNYVPHEERE